MMRLKPLNRKDVSKILEQIGSEYGCDAKKLMIDDFSFFQSEKNRVYIMNNSIRDINLDNVRVNSLGLYFCELNRDNIRLSIEGSQIIGKIATKNVVELDDVAARSWMKGNDMEFAEEHSGFVIIKNNGDFLGCGKWGNGKLFNYFPKIRRIRASD